MGERSWQVRAVVLDLVGAEYGHYRYYARLETDHLEPGSYQLRIHMGDEADGSTLLREVPLSLREVGP